MALLVVLSKGGHPSKGRSFSHIGQGEGDFLIVIIIDLFIDK